MSEKKIFPNVFINSPGKKCWKMTEFQVPHKVAQITLMHAPKCYQNKHDTYTIPVYLYKGELYLLYILIYCKYKRDLEITCRVQSPLDAAFLKTMDFYGYYGFDFVMPPPQYVERFHHYCSNKKKIL